jgi:hypothetical protein
MCNTRSCKRPTSNEILNGIDSWGIDFPTIKNDEISEKIISQNNIIVGSFHSHFLLVKRRNQSHL